MSERKPQQAALPFIFEMSTQAIQEGQRALESLPTRQEIAAAEHRRTWISNLATAPHEEIEKLANEDLEWWER